MKESTPTLLKLLGEIADELAQRTGGKLQVTVATTGRPDAIGSPGEEHEQAGGAALLADAMEASGARNFGELATQMREAGVTDLREWIDSSRAIADAREVIADQVDESREYQVNPRQGRKIIA